MSEQTSERFCGIVDRWAEMFLLKNEAFAAAWSEVRFHISKSCLLNRTLYGGEDISATPCPVHKGTWSGVHLWGSRLGEDGKYRTVWIGGDGESVGDAEDEMLAAWRAAGCRCFQHRGCNCTTGWQPDEACGCIAPLKSC